MLLGSVLGLKILFCRSRRDAPYRGGQGKPQLMLSADGTIAKIIHFLTKSAIIEGSKFLLNQDPRDDSQVPAQRIGFAL